MSKYKYQIIAKCSKCGKVLTKSKLFTKKELIADWDQMVLSAPFIISKNAEGSECVCEDRLSKKINMDIDFIIRMMNGEDIKDYSPATILPKVNKDKVKELLDKVKQ